MSHVLAGVGKSISIVVGSVESERFCVGRMGDCFSVGKYQEKMKKIIILIDIIVICGMIDIEKVLPIDG